MEWINAIIDMPLSMSLTIVTVFVLVVITLWPSSGSKEKSTGDGSYKRSGHVYIISNEGSFGPGVFKVGMTRRDDPMIRVRELGDASVPFPFTIHAMIKTKDAPGLEKKLHHRLKKYRVNRSNERKEFFCTELATLIEIVKEEVPDLKMWKAKDSECWKASRRWNVKNRKFL